MDIIVKELSPLIQLLVIVSSAVWAISKISSTTQVLTRAIEDLARTTTRLEKSIDDLIRKQSRHDTRITVLETIANTGWDKHIGGGEQDGV